MKLINTLEAEGHILCHDMTEIVPGEYKKTRFKRGQRISAADIPVLLDMGKEQLYVWEEEPLMLHEEEGARRLSLLCLGENIRAAHVREGKIELFAEKSGLLKVRSEKLFRINSVGGMAVITLTGNRGVKDGDKVAAAKIIPLLIEEEKIARAEEISGGEKIARVLPYKPKKAGLIITGNEIFHKRKSDTGSGILEKKIQAFGGECVEKVILLDDPERITASIQGMIEQGLDLIICTGGMSVDTDDKTPLAIRNSGARIVSYGVPFMPGFMLLLSYYEKNSQTIPVIGAPACVFYEGLTVLDILLPRLMADDPVSWEDLALMGEGGLAAADN